MKNKKDYLTLKPSQLLTHPKNMRRFYPAEQVREMANSILAAKGVIEPLIVTRAPKSNKYLVIDGNMRLAAGRFLGKECPPLKCLVVDQSKTEQLLSMVSANQVRYDVDPVSEALHYKALRDEGLSIRDISKRTGIYESRIINRIILAELDQPIQELIANGKLPASPIAARAFLKLKSDVRVKFATRLAENPNTKISTIEKACERFLEDKAPERKLKHPAAELSGAHQSKNKTASAKRIRASAKVVCKKCNQVEDKLREGDEPAWSMLTHAADDTCNNCELKDMQRICTCCPAVQLLRNLVKSDDK